MSDLNTISSSGLLGHRAPRAVEHVPCLVLVWSVDEPGRAGEIAVPRDEESVIGRGEGPTHLEFLRTRPGRTEPCPPLSNPRISRTQLAVTRQGNELRVVRRGKRELRVNGSPVDQAMVRAGDLIEIHNQLLLLVRSRPVELPTVDGPEQRFRFGRADELGIVGESPAAWELRGRIYRTAGRGRHVLIHGPSGTGKELVARAVHSASTRSAGPFVARNAATIPDGLVDAELFGNVANYPNAGMRERPGLAGAADRGDLFLDEIGELPEAVQAHLLRLLDDGEYQRLGDSKSLRVDVRMLGATNRALETLKEDLLARFRLRIEVPGLSRRIEDVPLLAYHLFRNMTEDDPDLGRFCGASGHPRIAPDLVSTLLRHPWTTHVRELERLLWEAADVSEGNYLVRPPDLTPGVPIADPQGLTPQVIQAALDRHHGVQEKVWRELGLTSRHALRRLIQKHDLVVRR